jgi:hypothetical protein
MENGALASGLTLSVAAEASVALLVDCPEGTCCDGTPQATNPISDTASRKEKIFLDSRPGMTTSQR